MNSQIDELLVYSFFKQYTLHIGYRYIIIEMVDKIVAEHLRCKARESRDALPFISLSIFVNFFVTVFAVFFFFAEWATIQYRINTIHHQNSYLSINEEFRSVQSENLFVVCENCVVIHILKTKEKSIPCNRNRLQ